MVAHTCPPSLGRLKQGNLEFKTSLGLLAALSPLLKTSRKALGDSPLESKLKAGPVIVFIVLGCFPENRRVSLVF